MGQATRPVDVMHGNFNVSANHMQITCMNMYARTHAHTGTHIHRYVHLCTGTDAHVDTIGANLLPDGFGDIDFLLVEEEAPLHGLKGTAGKRTRHATTTHQLSSTDILTNHTYTLTTLMHAA